MASRTRIRKRLKKALVYPIFGVVLSFSAPLGWLILKIGAHVIEDPSSLFSILWGELRSNYVLYGYMHLGAVLTLTLSGFALGWRDDRLRLHYNDLLSQRRLLGMKNRQLARLSITDRLTGLANYFRFNEVLAIEFKRALRYHLELCVIMVDIDHFKKINDSNGHYFGDYVLHELGQLFASIRRESDYIARTGGEEFAFILTQTNIQDALKFAERVREAVASFRFEHDGKHREVTLSAGVASIKDIHEISDDDKGKRLMVLADDALYIAKRHGRNRVERYHPRPMEVPVRA